MEITKDTMIGEIINKDMDAGTVLATFGMHCFMCPSAQGETLGEAAEVHGVDCDKLVNALRAYFSL